ncbi:MAG: hypothetical protein NTZ59_02265 [Bacteroidetes bacterium]|nr:hypothetical protein [Bacteroidota bacterium]
MKKAVQALSLGKYRLLKKSSKGKDVNDDDTFTLNQDFDTPLSKFKLLPISTKDAIATGNNSEKDLLITWKQ